MIPKYEGGWLHPQARAEEPRVPSKEVAIDPINLRGELASLVLPRGKNQELSAQFSTV